MTRHRIKLMRLVSCTLMMVFLMMGMNAPSALAQKYKDALSGAREAVEAGNYTTAYRKYEEAYRGAQSAGDQEVMQAVRADFYDMAAAASQEGATTAQADQALDALTSMQEYVEPEPELYYYMAESYKAKRDYQQSIAMADKALEIHRGSKTDKAKIYFVKGEALMSLNYNKEAKAAFENAAYGSYKARAEAYLEQLAEQ